MKFLRKAWKAVSTLVGGRRHSGGGFVFAHQLYDGPETGDFHAVVFAAALKQAQEQETAARCMVGAIMQQQGRTVLRISKKTLREIDLRSLLEVVTNGPGYITIRLLPPEHK